MILNGFCFKDPVSNFLFYHFLRQLPIFGYGNVHVQYNVILFRL